jgi:hypothetical protein
MISQRSGPTTPFPRPWTLEYQSCLPWVSSSYILTLFGTHGVLVSGICAADAPVLVEGSSGRIRVVAFAETVRKAEVVGCAASAVLVVGEGCVVAGAILDGVAFEGRFGA